MEDVTPILIKDLSGQSTLADTDYFIVGGTDAKKITVAQMKAALGINTLHTQYFTENLTCAARTFREYTFQGLPDHKVSFPIVINATSDMTNCAAYRNPSVTGGVKVYSPISQDVTVMLILLM